VLETRPPESTREDFVGQPLKVELYETRLEAVVGGRSKKTWEASASRLETSCLGRVSRHYWTPLLFDFRKAFASRGARTQRRILV